MESLTANKINDGGGENFEIENLNAAIVNLWQSLKSASEREKVLRGEYETQSDALVELNSLKVKYERQSSDLNQIKLSKTDLEKRYGFAREKISAFEKIEIQYNSQKDELQALRINTNNLQEKLKDSEFSKKEISRLGKEVISRNREIDLLKNENAKLSAKLFSQEDETQKNIEKINYLVTRNDDLKGENVGLSEEVDSLKINLSELNKNNAEIESALSISASNISSLEKNIESYKSEMNGLRKKVNSQTRSEQPADLKRISELENEVNYSNSRLAKAEQILEELNRQITQRDEIIQKINLNEESGDISQRIHEDNSKLMEIIMAKDTEISKIKNELGLRSDKIAELNTLVEKENKNSSGDDTDKKIQELQNHQRNLENVIENKSFQLKDLERRLSSDEIKLNREEKIAIATKIETVIAKVENLLVG